MSQLCETHVRKAVDEVVTTIFLILRSKENTLACDS